MGSMAYGPDTRPRIRLAGCGLVCPLGLDAPRTWEAVCAGKSGIRRTKNLDLEGLEVRIAGEVDLPKEPWMSSLLGREVTHRKEQFALMAFEEALADAGIGARELRRVPTGIFTGCEKEETDDVTFRRGRDGDDCQQDIRQHRYILQRAPDAIERLLLQLTGDAVVAFNYSMACSASAVAIAQAMRWMRRGAIERALILGVDTPVNRTMAHQFQMLGALSTQGDAARASRPFDAARDGFVLAEGAGAMVLETEELWARRSPERQAPTLRGFGITNNCSHMTKTPPEGRTAARTMQMALDDAGISASEIGYINAHATSTDVGDASEARAIAAVFGGHRPVSSTKSMTGHLIAAAGIVEATLTAFAVRDGWLPPTLNLDSKDHDCAIDVIAHQGRSASIRYALSNSFGFGGTNVSIVIER